MDREIVTAFDKLNITPEQFDQIIADEGAREEIHECLMLCLTSVPSLKDVASALLQYIAECGETNADGGPGSGNFGHEGRPGEVGGSATGPFGTLSAEAISIIQAHRDNPMHFGETDEQKAATAKKLADALRTSGVKVDYDPNAYSSPYHAFAADLTYQENKEINSALNIGSVSHFDRTAYIEACREAGVEPRLSKRAEEAPEWALYSKSGKLQSDGTPVYMGLNKESLLSDAELIEFSGHDAELSPDKAKAVHEAAERSVSAMTEEQRAAVRGYTQQYSATNYSSVNEYLATGQGSQAVQDAAKQITAALDREIGAPCVVSRGDEMFYGTGSDAVVNKIVQQVARGDFSSAGKLKSALEGKTITAPTVLSTTPGDAMQGFNSLPVQMIFKAPSSAKGVDITSVSSFGGGRSAAQQALAATGLFGTASHETEIAFKPGTKYAIEKVEFSLDTSGKNKKGQVFVVASILSERSDDGQDTADNHKKTIDFPPQSATIKSQGNQTALDASGQRENGNWITINGAHCLIDDEGTIVGGPSRLIGECAANHASKKEQKSQKNTGVSDRGRNLRCLGFEKRKTLSWKLRKHGISGYAGLTIEQFEKKAVDLLEKPCKKGIDGYVDRDGAICRFDTTTGDFAKGYPGRYVKTMFNPGYLDDGTFSIEKARDYFFRHMEEESDE